MWPGDSCQAKSVAEIGDLLIANAWLLSLDFYGHATRHVSANDGNVAPHAKQGCPLNVTFGIKLFGPHHHIWHTGTILDQPQRESIYRRSFLLLDAPFPKYWVRDIFLNNVKFLEGTLRHSLLCPDDVTLITSSIIWCFPPVNVIRQNGRLFNWRRFRHIDMPAQSTCDERTRMHTHSAFHRPSD